MSFIKTRIAKAGIALALTAGLPLVAGMSPAGAEPVNCARLRLWIISDTVRAEWYMRDGVNYGYLGDGAKAVGAFDNAMFLFGRVSNMSETYNANC